MEGSPENKYKELNDPFEINNDSDYLKSIKKLTNKFIEYLNERFKNYNDLKNKFDTEKYCSYVLKIIDNYRKGNLKSALDDTINLVDKLSTKKDKTNYQKAYHKAVISPADFDCKITEQQSNRTKMYRARVSEKMVYFSKKIWKRFPAIKESLSLQNDLVYRDFHAFIWEIQHTVVGLKPECLQIMSFMFLLCILTMI